MCVNLRPKKGTHPLCLILDGPWFVLETMQTARKGGIVKDNFLNTSNRDSLM